MGLKTLVSRGGYYARLGAYIRGYHGSYPPHPPLGNRNLLAVSLSGQLASYGLWKVPNAIGYYDDSGDDVVVDLLSTKPVTSKYDGKKDWGRYGGYLSSMSAGVRLLNGARLFQDVPGNERDTRHNSFQGTLGPMVDADDWFDQKYITVPSSLTVGGINAGFTLNRSSGLYQNSISHVNAYPIHQYLWYPTSNPSWAPTRTVSSVIDDIVSGRLWGIGNSKTRTYSWGGTETSVLVSFDYEYLYPGGIDVSWVWRIFTSDPNEIGDTSWRLTFRSYLVGTRTSYVHPPDSGIVSIGDAFTFREEWGGTCLSASNPARSYVWFGDFGLPGAKLLITNSDGNRAVGTLLTSQTYASPRGDDAEVVNRIVDFGAKCSFHRHVSDNQGSIIASAFQSTSSALEVLEDGLNTNLIEQLSQLSGIADYLPRLHQALAIVRTLKSGDLPSTIGEIVDLVAELRLRYAFQYAPDFDFLTTELPRVGKVAGQLFRQGTDVVVARGVFRYDFSPGEFGREVCSLETRTKVVAKRDNDSVLAKVLGIDALGLLPSAANAWDLVPLSFVLDWFVDIRSRIRDLEAALLMVALGPSYYCHSFRVVSPISDQEMGLMRVRSQSIRDVGFRRPELVWYTRHISRQVPPPRLGKYDFRMPDRLPSWATAGALGWKLLT